MRHWLRPAGDGSIGAIRLYPMIVLGTLLGAIATPATIKPPLPELITTAAAQALITAMGCATGNSAS